MSVTQAAPRRTRGLVMVSPGGTKANSGMGSVTRSIVDWLRQSEPDIDVFVVDPRGHGPRWQFPLYFAIAILQLIWIRLTRGPDVLHLQMSEGGSFLRKGVLAFIGRMLGMRVILHHHGAELIPFFNSASPPVKRWISWVMRKADLNIVLGDKWGLFLVQTVGVQPDEVAVLYNATPASKAAPKAQTPREGDTVKLLLLAVIQPRKGVSEFLSALSVLHKEGLPVSAVLAGSGQIERYAREAEALGVADICTFAGWVDRAGVDRALSDADAMVLPSYEEGLPMAILESLSASVPVVATRVGSIPEVLEDGVTALLVDAKDVGQLADAMRRIVLDGGLRQTLSRNGRALFEENFEMDPYMARMLAFYEGG